MKFYNLHDRLERLWKNLDLDIELEYERIFDFLSHYPSEESEEKGLNNILEVTSFEETKNLKETWDGGGKLSNGFALKIPDYPDAYNPKHIPIMLVDIILNETRLKLIEYHSDEISSWLVEVTLPELERSMRRFTAMLEYYAAMNVKNPKTNVSLLEAYIRHYKFLKSKTASFIRSAAIAYCQVIYQRINAGEELIDKYVRDTLKELRKIVNYANKKKIGLSIDNFWILYQLLLKYDSPFAQDAFKLCKSIHFSYDGEINKRKSF